VAGISPRREQELHRAIIVFEQLVAAVPAWLQAPDYWLADAPLAFVRAGLYRYRFTSLRERRATGAWWQRERVATLFLLPQERP
jgi:hypothetical protein